MSILEEVSAQLKTAMRAREKDKIRALRGIRASFLNEMKSNGADSLTDEQCVTQLRRMARQRKESIATFGEAGREDLVAIEQAELDVIDTFLPSLADEATTRAWVQEAIEQTGATSSKEVGRVMGTVMKAHRGDVDGQLARKIVQELLAD